MIDDFEKRRRLSGVWRWMQSRCNNPNVPGYIYYGGKGVRNLFAGRLEFIEWALVSGYEIGLQIDRIEVDGDYSPENCRFLTRAANLARRGRKRLACRPKVVRDRIERMRSVDDADILAMLCEWELPLD